MVLSIGFTRQLHTGIVLTASGVSRCVEVEGFATLTPIPLISQIGIGVSFDVPVVAEACGLGSIGVDEDVEIRVYGRGLSFSNPALPRLLEEVVIHAYLENGSIDSLDLSEVGEPLASVETIVASLEGSTLVMNHVMLPIYDLSGLWGVIIKLRKPLAREKIVEELVSNIGRYEDIILANIDDPLTALYDVIVRLNDRIGLRPLSRFIKIAEEYSVLAPIIDISGRLVAFIVDSAEAAFEVSNEMIKYGDVIEAPTSVLYSS
ncbi:hypothetical protein PYJP_04270 [Pyrofollis japonicus]|uniref:hypothetical protein n=1 Tax=Pyrofollis japonicus TaxID=3060460 RepID=UPI00295AE203|nr:hypothetical protein [Pyrofollis japonicus]BEP17075.1 hypothetical protein PYJP_04270 [Pyrofollis japonicus]